MATKNTSKVTNVVNASGFDVETLKKLGFDENTDVCTLLASLVATRDSLETAQAENKANRELLASQAIRAKTYGLNTAYVCQDRMLSSCKLILADTSKYASLWKAAITVYSRVSTINRVTSKVTTGLESGEEVYSCYRVTDAEFARICDAISYHFNNKEGLELITAIDFDTMKKYGRDAYIRAIEKRADRKNAVTSEGLFKDSYTAKYDIVNKIK